MKSTRGVSLNLYTLLSVGLLTLAMNVGVGNSQITEWVGDQSDQDRILNIHAGAYFNGINWLNYTVPTSGTASFSNENFLLNQNSNPEHHTRHIYFGDCVDEYDNGNRVYSPAGHVTNDLNISIETGEWFFNQGGFGSPEGYLFFGITQPQLGIVEPSSFFVGKNASLTLQGNFSSTFGFALDGVLTLDQTAQFASQVTSYIGSDRMPLIGGPIVGAILNIDSPGATWRDEFHTWVGGTQEGHKGSINIENGGKVESGASGALGRDAGTHGKATISGLNSEWRMPHFYVGDAGSGNVEVSNGGQIRSMFTVEIGRSGTGNGDIEVFGSGSRLSTEIFGGGIYVGGDQNGSGGTGRLEISNSALVQSASDVINWQTGTISIDSGGRLEFARTFCNYGTVQVSGGQVVGAPNSSICNFGTFHVEGGGGIIADLTLASGSFSSTQLIGDLYQTGGIVRPGSSPGEMVVLGDYTVENGVVEMELAGVRPAIDFDVLNVNGDIVLNGGVLRLLLQDGFTPSIGDSFHLFQFQNLFGEFDSLDFQSLPTSLAWDSSSLYLDGTVSVVQSVPESSNLCLLSMFLFSLIVQWRKKKENEHVGFFEPITSKPGK